MARVLLAHAHGQTHTQSWTCSRTFHDLQLSFLLIQLATVNSELRHCNSSISLYRTVGDNRQPGNNIYDLIKPVASLVFARCVQRVHVRTRLFLNSALYWRFSMVRRRGEDHRHSTHSLKTQQPFKDKSCTKINKMAKCELWDAVCVFAAVLFMYGCRILKGCKEEGGRGGRNDTSVSKAVNFCFLIVPPVLTQSSSFVCFHCLSTLIHRTMWMWTFLLFDPCDSRVAAVAAVGCLMQQPINNQCLLQERTP